MEVRAILLALPLMPEYRMSLFILALPSPPSPILLFIGFPGETAFRPHRPVFASRDTP